MNRAEVLAKVLAEHQRVRGLRDGVPTLDIHCACGWTHRDRFLENNDIHRAHVAAALDAALATHDAEVIERDRQESAARIRKYATEYYDSGQAEGFEVAAKIAAGWLR